MQLRGGIGMMPGLGRQVFAADEIVRGSVYFG